jgi:hypothetical protein
VKLLWSLSIKEKNMIHLPPYLDSRDTIGILCPAGYMAKEKADRCIGFSAMGFQGEDWRYAGRAFAKLFFGTR